MERHASTLIIGGGTSGCVLANRLSADPSHTVILVEAGPDYGPADSGRWPDLIRFGNPMMGHHDWGYQALTAAGARPYYGGKVVGGSSAVNAAGVARGLREDYDAWAAMGNPGWDDAGLRAAFERVERQLPIHRIRAASPLLTDLRAAAADAGVPPVDDVTGPDARAGLGEVRRNVQGGQRMTAAFAYLDPARARPNLTVLADTVVEALDWSAGRVRGARVVTAGQPGTITADRVVVTAGAVGSPLLLQRSGIGDPALLRGVLGGGVAVHALPGVGRNLRDHYGVIMLHLLGESAAAQLFGAPPAGPPIPPTLLMRIRSSPELEAFDHDVFCFHPAVAPPRREDQVIRWRVFLVRPESRGSVAIGGPAAGDPPRVETGFGPERDLAALARAVAWVRRVAADARMAAWIEREVRPGPELADARALAAWAADNLDFYFHPVGTCRMGPASDPASVVDAGGRVHGFDNLFVADASVMPTIPGGMIQLTVFAVAEKLAEALAASG